MAMLLLLSLCWLLLCCVIVPLCLAGVALVFLARAKITQRRRRGKRGKSSIVVGLFHPYCNDGGGGERVLWCGIRALQELLTRTDPKQQFAPLLSADDVRFVVYTGDQVADDVILDKAKKSFGIEFTNPIEFVRLKNRRWVEKERWPHFTILGQSIGSLFMAWEALQIDPPDLFIDTMGYSFTYPLARYIGGCRVACYVHYPTISSDMIQKVGRTSMRSLAKLIYYRMFALLYSLMGHCSEVVMVNSSWTRDHIDALWNIPQRTTVVYPPCDTTQFKSIPLNPEKRENIVVSLGQFRPEKNHELQLQSFALFLKSAKRVEGASPLRLVLIGGCRGDADLKRLEGLRKLSVDLGIQDDVEFRINVTFEELKAWLGRASAGLHTMWCEHFGIGIVEMMAAGVLTIAHNSGGPKSDIIEHGKTGYLAASAEEYAACMQQVAMAKAHSSREEEKQEEEEEEETKETKEEEEATLGRFGLMQECARRSVGRFSDEKFAIAFTDAMRPLCLSLGLITMR